MTKEQIKALDISNMYDVLKDFHVQIEDAVRIANQSDFPLPDMSSVSNVIVNGLGGSAIGGDFVRSAVLYDAKLPVSVNRNYDLPTFAGKDTLCFVSSYSGNTEETISALHQALERECKIICITTGGEIAELAKSKGLPLITVPEGFQPRCALGYSFFVLYGIFQKLGIIENKSEETNSTIDIIRELSRVYSDINDASNPAIKLARTLHGKLPVVYSADILDVVNVRWRGQISENAKILAYGSFYPEMNHNELVGWKCNEEVMKDIAVIILKDHEDHDRNKLRMKITAEIYRKHASDVIELEASGRFKLGRIFELTYLGDWVSYYLAILNNEDPTPVNVIQHLKKQLSEN